MAVEGEEIQKEEVTYAREILKMCKERWPRPDDQAECRHSYACVLQGRTVLRR